MPVTVRGVSYSSAAELEQELERLDEMQEAEVSDLRDRGRHAEADRRADAYAAESRRLQAALRELKAKQAAATPQPARPPAAPPTRPRSSPGRQPRSSTSARPRPRPSRPRPSGDLLDLFGPAGPAVEAGGSLVMEGLGLTLAIIALWYVLRPATAGASALESAGGGLVGGLHRLILPIDPLSGKGIAAAQASVDPAVQAAAADVAGAHAPPSSVSLPSPALGPVGPGPTVTRPSGRIVAMPGAPNFGLRVDAAYVPLVAWIESHFGVRATSLWRSRAHNAAVGGANQSDHLSGAVGDFVGTPAAMNRLAGWAKLAGFPFVETPAMSIAAGEGAHTHISFWRP